MKSHVSVKILIQTLQNVSDKEQEIQFSSMFAASPKVKGNPIY